MAQASRKSNSARVAPQVAVSPRKGPDAWSRGLRELVFLLLLFMAAYVVLALFTFSPQDRPFSLQTATDLRTRNAGGVIGAWIAYLGFLTLGYMAYLLPLFITYLGWMVFRSPRTADHQVNWLVVVLRILGFALIVGATTALAEQNVVLKSGTLPNESAGGVVGHLLAGHLASFGKLGSGLLFFAVLLVGISLLTRISWLGLLGGLGRAVLKVLGSFRRLVYFFRDKRQAKAARREREKLLAAEQKRLLARRPPKIAKIKKKIETSVRVEREKQVPLLKPAPETELPPLSLLDAPQKSTQGYSEAVLETMSRQVELKLRDFGVEATVEAVLPGPVVTLFELELAPGVKVSQVSNLAKDLARALSAISVRVVEVIPGKSVIGLEVPNEHRELITLGEILRSEEYDVASSPLTIALGKDISGNPIVVDLVRMPHLLIAGTTGSGKSVAINAMILSLLYKATPAEVRLIMIDPKMLELSIYEGIPHLLTPVVTDMRDAANALRWCVGEMERRYRVMAALGVRNLAGYNRKVKDAIDLGKPILDPLFIRDPLSEDQVEVGTLKCLPMIVVIIDELADMMMSVGKKVEELIARLAQKARASGIHMLLATQRPSVNVITGLIKSNIPTRIAFQVSAKVDSRTIIDQNGAEALLGHGDMLYLTPGGGVPVRVHGAFVSDQEVHKVAGYLKSVSVPDYVDDIVSEQNDPLALLPGESADDGGFADSENDEYYDQAAEFIIDTQRVSISSIQRRFRIGYNRAARIVEGMERSGLVSRVQTNGSREVMVPRREEE